MTAAILWKEYRQQRGVWLAVILIAFLIAAALYLVMGEGQGEHWFRKDRPYYFSALLGVLAAFQGLLAGVLLFSEEKERGTAVFLDQLSGNRRLVFQRKLLAGLLLAISLSPVLIALDLKLGAASRVSLLALLNVGIDGLAWGILVGVLLRSSLIAILAGIVAYTGGWFLTMMLALIVQIAIFGRDEKTFVLVAARAITTLAALSVAWFIYCRSDYERKSSGLGVLSRVLSLLPSNERVLLWLILRQGRWLLLAAIPLFLIGGPFMTLVPFFIWPAATMIAGMIFGLFCFAPEQPDAARFLGAQRFGAGRIWLVKVLFWAATLATLVWLAWFLAWRVGARGENWYHMSYFFEGLSFGNRFMLVAIWPLYGYCFGLFFGQITSRPIIAFFLTLMLAPVIAFLWVPSLLLGGVPIWWVLSIPLILLAASRLLMRPWLCGRLTATKPLAVMFGCAVLIPLSIVSFLMYRTVQIPDAGEPFDVQAFLAELEVAKKNEAGPLLREASRELREHEALVEKEFVEPKEVKDVVWGWRHPAQRWDDVQNSGWPKGDEELGRWLDRMFEGEWVKKGEKAAHLPLAALEDPRATRTPHRDGAEVYWKMPGLFAVRALQLQAAGDSLGGLHHLETALALSRQAQNFAFPSDPNGGTSTQNQVLAHYMYWLEGVRADGKLLQAGRAALQRHEAALPDPVNTVKAQYLVKPKLAATDFAKPLDMFVKILDWSCRLPWEQNREARLYRALTDDTTKRMSAIPRGVSYQTRGTKAQPYDYPYLLFPSFVYDYLPWRVAMGEQKLRAAQLVTAISTYQADHGKPPETLHDLVPKYLATLPQNPFGGESFGYRIATQMQPKNGLVSIAKGQPYIWGEYWGWWPDELDKRTKRTNYWPVPMWNKETQP